ncbi:Aste57867_9805 [Aphanomyces stellatus]|uniref:Aste57867_9805 protein n=1 Tax=Aphanomyces stellatus TaxID=120398 RepID=A0A485KP85_9STRA|nr:hypothetical protein As57867_009766 [Aphanomyces stellatus]VFT86684.1 Aste57867_9805 [Aphanomyces stellatus]
MWKPSSSIVGKTNGLDDLPMVLQQEINDFLHFSQNRKQQKLIPRINKVDFTKAMPDSDFVVCLQLQIFNKDYIDGWPLSSMTSIASMSLTSITLERDRGKFCLAMRIPKMYPRTMPDISCVSGGEYVPVQLKRGAAFVMPWIANGWPDGYSLVQFAEDLCTALGAPEKISTASFNAEQMVFPLDQVRQQNYHPQSNQLFSPASATSPPVSPLDSTSAHQASVDLLMMDGADPFQAAGPPKKHTSNKKSSMPDLSKSSNRSPHTSTPKQFSDDKPRNGATTDVRRVSPPPTHDLLNMDGPPAGSSSAAMSMGSSDLLGLGHMVSPRAPAPWQNGSTHQTPPRDNLLHVQIPSMPPPASSQASSGNRSPVNNVQSPRESIYRSNECCIKCKCKGEARRFVFDRNLSFQHLEESIKRLFQFPVATVLTLVYLDSDGDKCGLSSDEELRAALSHFPDTLILHAEAKPGEPPMKAEPAATSASPINAGVKNGLEFNDVKLEKCIGVGSSCKVYKAIWRGTEVAIKKFTSQNAETVNKEFKHEVQMMLHLGCHPCIVLLLAVCTTPKSIVFEYLPFSLFEQINGSQDPSKKIPPFPNTWQKRLQMIMDVARGLQFLHSFNIVHRDLKSLNLLITDEGRVKLADFGIAKVAQDEFMTRCCGTYQWMAPEVIVSQSYSVSADIYSFGVVMWEICEASVPFADTPAALVAMAVIQENKRPTISPNIPTPLKDLIARCWHKDAGIRPDAATIVNALTNFLQASQSPT